MPENPSSSTLSAASWTYQIRIEGHLGPQWADWFGGMAIALEQGGDTLLTGPVVDQPALYALLKKVRDLGMPLVSVVPVSLDETQPDRSNRPKGESDECK